MKNRGLHNPTGVLPKQEKRSLATKVVGGALFVGDTIAIVSSLAAAYWVRFESGWVPFFGQRFSTTPTLREYGGLILLGAAFLLALLAGAGVYDRGRIIHFHRLGATIVQRTAIWGVAYLFVSLAFKLQPPISRLYVVLAWVVATGALLMWRWLLRHLVENGPLASRLRQNILFIGWTTDGERLLKAVLEDGSQPYRVAGYISAPDSGLAVQPPHWVSNLGSYSRLGDVIITRDIDIVVLADLNQGCEKICEMAALCEKEYVQFTVIPSYFQTLLSGLRLENISGVPILGIGQQPLDSFLNQGIKRCMDVAGAVFGLLVSAPVVALFAALVYRESPGPVFYRQVRTGRNGKGFEIFKIRSMRLDAETAGAQWARRDDPRRLKVGAFMREWNIDEIPQFWNVLKGDMSLVGPRPERPELIADFRERIPRYNARHACKPGMTGWAQVNGLRGDTDLGERVRYDIWYLENWSVWLDIQIMCRTFINRKNAY